MQVKTSTYSSVSKRVGFTFDEAYQEALKYFKGDELAARVWTSKYALKDSFGNIYEKSPDEMHKRLAKEISRIEQKYPNPLSEKEVYDLIKKFKYIIPAGSPMSGIGNKFQAVSLSNCFVIGEENPADSYGGILKIDQEQVQLMKRRGGVGHDLSHIRPKGSPVSNSALTSTGVIPYIERYSNSTREVAQDGRRGALMLSISIKHPDAENFIDAKLETGKVTGANISVKIDHEFMKAVIDNKPYQQQYPVNSDNPVTKKVINPRKLWKKIIYNAWKSAEPGILFWDTVITESVADSYAEHGFETVSTNPCGEIPLCPYDSCRLLAVNLYSYVDNPFSADAKFNFDKFKQHARYAQQIMDDIIDLELEKIDGILVKIDSDPESDEIKRTERNLWEKIKEKAVKGRRTGVGITAEGDMLAALNLRYGSENATDFSVLVHKTLAVEAYRSSVEMAKDRGAFELFDAVKEKENPFIDRIKKADPKLYEEMVKRGRRNIALLTIAPTGTVSIMAQTTSGIEPAFMAVYERNVKVEVNDKNTSVDFEEDGSKWHTYNVFHPKFKEWLIINGYDFEKIKDIKDKKELNELVKKSPYYGANSNNINWVKKVEMQGAIQKWIDHSISATTNLPKDTPKEVVAKVYMKAWESGCKGMTVYVEGSRGKAILNSGKNLEGKVTFPKKRPENVDADILRFTNNDQNGGEDWIAFVGKIEGKPYEIFTGRSEGAMLYIPPTINKGKIKKISKENESSRYDFTFLNEGGFNNVVGGISHQFQREYWNLARLVSGHLKEGTPLPNLIRIVSKLDNGEESINSWKNGVMRALKKYIKDGTKTGEICEVCKMPIIFQNSCETCGCGEKCS